MTSFADLAKEREKEQSKLYRKGFKGVKPPNTRSGTAAGGGSVSTGPLVSLTSRVNDLESGNNTSITEVENEVDTLDTKVDTIEQEVGTLESNLNTLNATLGAHNHDATYYTKTEVAQMIADAVANVSVVSSASVPVVFPDNTGAPTSLSDRPTISRNQYGRNFDYTRTWSDEFNDSNALSLFNRWHPDQMTEALHQVGNDNELGWRWSGQYTLPLESSFVFENSLHMRAFVLNETHTFRKQFTWRGQTLNPQDHKIYLSFLTTWARKWDNANNRFSTDPDAPDRTWGPGTFHEFKVDLTDMRTQACRISFYLLPAYENDSNSYDPDGANGVEIDNPEIDFLDGYENYAQAKVLSEVAAGNTPNGSIDLAEFIQGLDLTTGVHTFGLLWQKDKLVWYVDGIEYQRETDPRRIPQTAHYWVISREANSGIRPANPDGQGGYITDDGTNAYSDDTLQMPVDVGIWSVPVYAEIDKLHDDTAKVLSFSSFTFPDTSTAGVALGDDSSGISPTMGPNNPPTTWTSNTIHTFTWNANGRTVGEWYLQVGATRGGNELGTVRVDGNITSASIAPGFAYSGPVNARLWFREDEDSVWHWRDFGFTSGLQPYRTGTDGLLRVATSSPRISTPPTVGGEGWVSGSGRDGTYATQVTYPNSQAKPSSYRSNTIGLGIEIDNLTITLPMDGKYWQIQNITDVNNVVDVFEGSSTGQSFTLTAGNYKFINFTDGTELSSVAIPVS